MLAPALVVIGVIFAGGLVPGLSQSLGDRDRIQTRRRFARFHPMPQDFEDLGGVGDDGDEPHGAVTATANQRVRVVDLLDQACPCGAALLGRDGQLGWRLLGGTDMNAGLPLMVALPPLGSEADQVRLTGPCTADA